MMSKKRLESKSNSSKVSRLFIGIIPSFSEEKATNVQFLKGSDSAEVPEVEPVCEPAVLDCDLSGIPGRRRAEGPDDCESGHEEFEVENAVKMQIKEQKQESSGLGSFTKRRSKSIENIQLQVLPQSD